MTDRRTQVQQAAIAIILSGASSNLAFATYRLSGGVNLFALAVLLWVVGPWLLLGATLKLRPLGLVSRTVVMLAALVLLVVSTAVYYDNFIAPPDGLDGVIFIITPFMGLVGAGVIFSFVWSVVRSKKNATT